MSSELQLDVCCRSWCGGDIWWTLTKERQAWCYLQVKLCDPRLSALSVVATIKALYKYTSFLSFYSTELGYVQHWKMTMMSSRSEYINSRQQSRCSVLAPVPQMHTAAFLLPCPAAAVLWHAAILQPYWYTWRRRSLATVVDRHAFPKQ